MSIPRTAIWIASNLLFALAAVQNVPEPKVFPNSTCKLEQLTGERDTARGVFTRSRTKSSAGLIGTDLGSSFEHDGKLYFLFGDSVGGAEHADVLAWTGATTPDAVSLSFHTNIEGHFSRLAVPGIASGPFEIPSYGISLDGVMYVVFTTDHSAQRTMGRSVLARSMDDGRSFKLVFDLSTKHFINVAMEQATKPLHKNLPASDCVLIWGSGAYRASSPRLACVPTANFGEHRSWIYFAGTVDGVPRWVAEEERSVDLFDHPVVGELSVAWIEQLERWVMFYNSSAPRGIVMRTAQEAWGPWSEPEVIFDPWLDKGYAQFMHVAWSSSRMDSFHDPGQEDKWGGEYGPYLIPRFTTGDADRCTLVFTMSTWNPYQVVLMTTDVGRPKKPGRSRETRFLLGAPPCPTSGSNAVGFERNGVPYISTFGELGDRGMIVSHMQVRPTRTSSLSFSVHGGHARIVLVREEQEPPKLIQDIPNFQRELMTGRYGPVLESIAGPNNNEVDVSVRWNLSRHVGEQLRVYLVDAVEDAWGFLSVSEMTLHDATDDR